MSLTVDKISDGTTEVDAGYVVNGSAKVWASLNGVTFGLRDSLNVSSAIDNGNGDYTLNFTSYFSSINSSFTTGFWHEVANGLVELGTPTTSSLPIYHKNSSNTAVDNRMVNASGNGDLA
jgi:hypothetical protein